ncbi:unnamed protein product [Brassica oleracea]
MVRSNLPPLFSFIPSLIFYVQFNADYVLISLLYALFLPIVPLTQPSRPT